jgi:integrase
MTQELTTTAGGELSRSFSDLSIISTEAALRRPLSGVVAAALNAASKSRHTRRAYDTAIATFIDYLETERGHLLPDLPEIATWRPFVQKRVNGGLVAITQDTGKAKIEHVYSDVTAAVLRLVDAALLDAYAGHRRAMGDSENTVVSRLAAVRAFLSVALRDNVLTQKQAVNMGLSPYKAKVSRDQEVIGRRLSKAEVRTLLGAVDVKTTKGKRDLAMLCCMLYAGLRVEETAHLRLNNLKLDKGRWWLVLKGKRKKKRRIKIHDALFETLSDWTTAAGLGDWGQDRRPLFYTMTRGDNLKDSQVTPTDVSRLVAAAGAAAGLAPSSGPGRLGAHDLRRTAARNAYDNGATLLQVQRLLGHSDPKTTARYIGLGEEETETAADFIHY